MTIHVLFFAQLRESFGKEQWVVEVLDGITAKELTQSLIHRCNLRSLESFPFLYAVNEQFENGDKKLKDQDVLAVMMPVAGGVKTV